MKNNVIEERIDVLESLKDYKHNYYQMKDDDDSEIKRYIIIRDIIKLENDILEAEVIQLGYKDEYKIYSVSFETVYAYININSICKISREQFQDFIDEFKTNLDKLMNVNIYF